MLCTNKDAPCLSGTTYHEETLLPNPASEIPQTTPKTVRSAKDRDQTFRRVVTA
jgi:hypothetical protein